MTTASCHHCSRRWTGLAEAHCSACHAHFTRDSVAELHRAGPMSARICLEPAGVLDKQGRPRMQSRDTRWGPIWSGRGPSPQDDPWTACTASGAGGTDSTWLARLIALEANEHDDDCCDPEDAP